MSIRSSDGAPPPATDLRRHLGLLDAIGVGFGAIVGAGIFVVTGLAIGIAGPAVLLALAVAGAAAAANALSSAELAAEYPRSGGTYEYGYNVLGPWWGYAAGWLFLASKISAAGTVALGLAGYLDALLPGLTPRWIAVGAIAVFTGLNYIGVRRSSRVNLLIVMASVGSLLVFVAAGAPAVDLSDLRPFTPFGWRPVLEASALLFFAYTGYARVATLGEEVADPRRTIPRAIVVTITGAIVLYLLVTAVAVGIAGGGAALSARAPLYDAALGLGSPTLGTVVALGGVTAMLGVILSQLLGLSRMVFAMARRDDLPSFLHHVHPRFGVPGRAVLAVGGVAMLVASTGTLRGVASAASFTILVYYAIANLAALRMPPEAKLYSDAVPAFGLVACVVLALSISPATMGVGVTVLGLGLVIRWVRMRGQGTGDSGSTRASR